MKRTKTFWLLMLGFLAAATSSGACSRAHLSSYYAQSYTAWFTAQHVKAKGSPEDARRVIDSLDAGEAGAVSRTYHRNVSKGGDDSGGSRLLMIGAPRAGGEGYIPPPSVPGQ